MKYGIILSGKVTEPVAIPAYAELDPAAWLRVQCKAVGDFIQDPVFGGYVLVSDDAVPGAVFNSPGNSTNPTIPVITPDPATIPKTQEQFEAWAVARLGSVQAWQSLLEKCVAQPGTTNTDRDVRYFPRWSQLPGMKTKSEFEARCTPLTICTPSVIVQPAALVTVLAQW